MARRRIKPAERKRQDYLRQRALKTGRKFEGQLRVLRAREVKRVLDICKDTPDLESWAYIIDGNLDERPYLPAWQERLFTTVGLPMAKSTAADMSVAKAASDESFWLNELAAYARERAGQNIVIVSETFRQDLIALVREEMESDLGGGVEKLTRRIYSKYTDLAKWQVRRIAQTETMIGVSDAADIAAKTLDISYTKQWCISGAGNTRETHIAMDGVEVEADEPFILAGGMLMYPHDISLGAEGSEIINCACACIRRPK